MARTQTTSYFGRYWIVTKFNGLEALTFCILLPTRYRPEFLWPFFWRSSAAPHGILPRQWCIAFLITSQTRLQLSVQNTISPAYCISEPGDLFYFSLSKIQFLCWIPVKLAYILWHMCLQFWPRLKSLRGVTTLNIKHLLRNIIKNSKVSSKSLAFHFYKKKGFKKLRTSTVKRF